MAFGMAALGHLDFSVLQSFQILTPASLLNFVEIGQTVEEIMHFIGISIWPTSAIFNTKSSKLLAADWVRRPVLHQHSKFYEDRSNRC